MKHSPAFKAIVNHYSNPANPPLSVKEFFDRFDTRKLLSSEHPIVNDLVVPCKDNMVRVRFSHEHVKLFK